MKTFTEQYTELCTQLEIRLQKLIEWKGVESKFVSEPCLKLDFDEIDCDYNELVFINERLSLLNENGYQYSLECIDIETLSQLTDRLNTFNPYASGATEYPLRHLADRTIDIDEYPNFAKSGSIEGMKKMCYGKGALLVSHGDYIYNVTRSPEIYFEHSDELMNERL